MAAQVFTHPDGRKTDYLISGAQDGFPLVFIHGTPGSYTVGSKLNSTCEGKGIKLITLSRAGYGGSTRNKGRRVVDAVADIQALLEHLDIKKCAVGGKSGGGEFLSLVYGTAEEDISDADDGCHNYRATLSGLRGPAARLRGLAGSRRRGTVQCGRPRLPRRPGTGQ